MSIVRETLDLRVAELTARANRHFAAGELAESEVRSSLPFHPLRAMRATDRRVREFAAAAALQKSALALLDGYEAGQSA